MDKLQELRESAVFADSKIITSDFKKFPVDRCVLSAISPYFRALYSNSLYSENQNREVFLPDISSEIMSIIIAFVYTGRLTGVKEANLEALIQALNRLQINGALDHCHSYLIESLTVTNCISKALKTETTNLIAIHRKGCSKCLKCISRSKSSKRQRLSF